MSDVRIAIVGTGNMANVHMANIKEIDGAVLSAVCDVNAERANAAAEQHGAAAYTDHKQLLADDVADAVIVATPHYFHTTIGIDSLQAGKHTLIEKPLSVHKADCERLIAAHTDESLVFAAMFNQRTDPKYKKLKAMIDGGELGDLVRVNWIMTTWFRTEAYYASGGWRATWKGEGGGVLLNQCPHQLDLLQWLCGVPSKVVGFCGIGKRHNIEVEDEVTAYLEYPNGATGVFITSTGETPGTNRLEVAGTKGRAVIEGDTIEFLRNDTPSDEFLVSCEQGFAQPETEHITIESDGSGGQHFEVLENFVNAIRNGDELIAPAAEGINSVELGNAILYSSLTGAPVDMPLDGAAYEAMLMKLIDESTFEKKVVETKAQDFSKSFR
jgi:predicted dehydrogenase